MSAERWRQLRVLYEQVLDAPAAERPRVLAAVEASHPDLHQELAALIAADSAPDSLLDQPATSLWQPELAAGDVLCDRFAIERQIGSGGMGEVWAARDRLRDDLIALKTIRRGLDHDERLWQRFTREMQLASRIAHPNICRVHELFEDRSVEPPRLFFTMELLDGETLAARLQRGGALPVAEALDLLRDICSALDAAHAAGVIHRDLKPANIMLVPRGERVRAVITDFGLAKPESAPERADDETVAGTLMGTPAYMAPEQVRGVPATPATDIYAVGLLLFEMLRGEPPFRGISTLDSWMRRAHEGPARLAGVVPRVPAAIDVVLQRCLEYEPDRRFQRARDLIAALDRRPLPGRKVLAAVAAAVIAAAAGIAWTLRPVTLPAGAQQWYDEAQQAVAEGAAIRARSAVSHVLSAAPGFPPAHALLAEVHLELDMPGDAIEDMARASQLVADGVRLTRADRLYVSGMHALALRECEVAVAALRDRALLADPSRPYRMVTAARALDRCNRPDDALAVLKDAAAVDPRNAAVPLRTSRVAGRRRRYDAALAALDAAEALFRDRNNAEGRSEVLLMRGTLRAEQDRLDDAGAALGSAFEIASSLMDERQQIRVLLQQVIVARKRGDMARAGQLADQALGRSQRAGLDALVIEALFTDANVYLVQRQYDKAEELLQDALRLAQRQRNEDAVAGARLRLASVFVPAAQFERAEHALADARPFYERTRDTRNLGKLDALAGQIAVRRADYAGAIASFESQVRAATAEKDPEEAAQARSNLATAYTLGGWYGKALPEFAALADYYRDTSQPVREAYAQLNRLDTLSRLGRFQDPGAFVTAAAIAPGSPPVQLYALQLRAEDALRRGDLRAAQDFARQAERSSGGATWSDQVTCLVSARLAERRIAERACNRALAGVAGQPKTNRWIDAQLVAAEARLWLHQPDAARALLARAAAIVQALKESETKWYCAALAAALERDPPRHAVAAALTRELTEMRLKLGMAYEDWARRSDVRALLQWTEPKETTTHG